MEIIEQKVRIQGHEFTLDEIRAISKLTNLTPVNNGSAHSVTLSSKVDVVMGKEKRVVDGEQVMVDRVRKVPVAQVLRKSEPFQRALRLNLFSAQVAGMIYATPQLNQAITYVNGLK